MTSSKEKKHRNLTVCIKRAYEPTGSEDGHRILVDRLWPRGIKKSDARIDQWWKNYAPSNSLRKWFGHDSDKWSGFCEKYAAELDLNRGEITATLGQIESDIITLVYGAKNERYNQAVVLKSYIETRILG